MTNHTFMKRALRCPLYIIQFGSYVLLIASACLEIVAVLAMMYVTLVLSEPDYSNPDVKKLAFSVLVVTPEILMFVAFYRGYQKRGTWWGRSLLALGGMMIAVSITTLLTVAEVIKLNSQGVHILNSVRFILVLLFNVAIHIPYLLQMAKGIEGDIDATVAEPGATVAEPGATVAETGATVAESDATVAESDATVATVPATPPEYNATVATVPATPPQQPVTVVDSDATVAPPESNSKYSVYALSSGERGIFQVGYATRNSLRTLVRRARNAQPEPITVSVVCETESRDAAETQKRNLQQFYEIS